MTHHGSPGHEAVSDDMTSWTISPGPGQLRRKSRRTVGGRRKVAGSVASEHAVVVGLVALGVIGALLLFGDQLRAVIGLAAVRLPTGSDARHEERVASSSQTRDAEAKPVLPATDAAGTGVRLSHIALATALAVPFVTWWATGIVRRTRRRRDGLKVFIPRPTLEAIRTRAEEKRQQLWGALRSDPEMLGQNRVRVRHLMTREVLAIAPTVSRDEVIRKFQASRVSHLLVCDSGQRLLGVISNRDLADRPGKTAADIMSAAVVVISPDATVSSAVSLLIERRISCLPVVAEDKVCGLVTSTDLLLTLQCAIQLWLRASQTNPQHPGATEGSGLADRKELEIFLDRMLAIRAAYGHEVTIVLAAFEGEELAGARLASATWLLVHQSRRTDLVGYLGENRFIAALPNTDLDAAEQISRDIRDSASREPLSDLGMTIRTAAIAPRGEEDAVAVLSRAASLLLESDFGELSCHLPA